MFKTVFILLLFVPGLAGQLTARVVNGTQIAGRLELFYNGTWSTVCDDSFHNKEATVACRMLGFDGIEATVVPSNIYGEGQRNILLDEVDCCGAETNLAQCQHRPYYRHDCRHTEDVGIICKLDTDHLLLTGTIRTRPEMGQLKVLLGNEWATPCVGNFNSNAAKVLCRELGFPSNASAAIAGSSFGPVEGQFVNVDLVCTGGERSILGCFRTIYGFSDNCSTDGFGVVCSDSIFTLFIILATNTSITENRLMEGSNVTLKCETLQQDPSPLFFIWPETAGGRPSGEYLIFDNLNREHNGSRVRCMANYNLSSVELVVTSDTLELKVYSMDQLEGYMEEDQNNASVIWNGTEQRETSREEFTGGSPAAMTENPLVVEIKARLVNGTANTGRLEIFHNGKWSTVCDDGFGNEEARVACWMLGFNSSKAVAVASSIYGVGSGTILLDDVECTGTEISLAECKHKTFYSHDCSHSEDVGVICKDADQLVARVVNGTAAAGRLEIFHNGEWSTVCDDSFGNKEAEVACRMLGFDSSRTTAVSSSTYGEGSGKILLDNLDCRGTEISFSQCEHTAFYSHDCKHSEDVGVVCNDARQLIARLAHGNKNAGRLEIFHNGEWSTVCDDGFENEEAKVACRMLGFESPVARAVHTSKYGAGEGNILLDDVDCRGTEINLSECNHKPFYSHNCGHSEDVGVICQDGTSKVAKPTAASTVKSNWEFPALTKPTNTTTTTRVSSSPTLTTAPKKDSLSPTKSTTTTTTTEKITTVTTTTTSRTTNATTTVTTSTTTTSTTTTVAIQT